MSCTKSEQSLPSGLTEYQIIFLFSWKTVSLFTAGWIPSGGKQKQNKKNLHTLQKVQPERQL